MMQLLHFGVVCGDFREEGANLFSEIRSRRMEIGSQTKSKGLTRIARIMRIQFALVLASLTSPSAWPSMRVAASRRKMLA
jgi:hypothetical protein